MLLDGVEFFPPDLVSRHQQRNWRTQRLYVEGYSEFYQGRFAGPGALPETLEALESVAFTDKEMLRADQELHPPFGSYLACRPDRVNRLHRTSGTTGQAMNLAVSHDDGLIHAAVAARGQRAAGLAPGDRVIHCLNYQMWMGGLTDHLGLEVTGATVIPFGIGNTELLVRTIRDLAVTAISCTPSYVATIERVIEDKFPALSPRDLGLRIALMGGEAGLDSPDFRARIENVWGMKAMNSNYGVGDALCNFAGQCEHQTDLHFMAADVLYPELIEPSSGTSLPWRAGEQGELVVTHLAKSCQPLVRFRTGDVIVLTATERCACGRTAPRFRVIGRNDDMIVVRGVNAFPTTVAASLMARPELNGEYRIVLATPPPHDRLTIEAEVENQVAISDALAASLSQAISRDLRLTAVVTLVPSGGLPRTDGKTKRVVRSYRDV